MNRAPGSAIPEELWEPLGAQGLSEGLVRWRCVLDGLRRTA